METYNKLCKVCNIKIKGTNFDLIDEGIRNVLDDLFPNMKIDDGIQHLICSICSIKLFAALDFKSVCLNTNNTIIPYVNIEESSPVDLKEIYVKEKGLNILEDKQICRLCMHPVNDAYYSIAVKTELASNIQMYVPEINFKVTVDPIICKMCHDSLFTHVSFIKNCLDVGRRKYKDDCPVINTDLYDSYIKTEEIEIKHEEEDEEDQEKPSETQFIEIKLEEEIKQESDLSLHFSGDEVNMDNIEQCNTEKLVKRESDEHNSETYNKHTREIKVDENNTSVKQQRREDPSEVKTYKYRERRLETKHMQRNRVQKLKDKDTSETQTLEMYKCNECQFQSKYKNCLRKHQRIHEDSSEVETLKCSVCKYETKYKEYLVRHQLIHKDPSEKTSVDTQGSFRSGNVQV